MTTRRPWLLWFLALVFLWSVGKDFQLILTHEQSADLEIFASHKLMTVFFAFMSALVVLDLAALLSVFRRRPEGLWICLAAAGANLVYDLVSMSLALDERSGIRAHYVAVQEMLGGAANPQMPNRVIAATMALSVLYRMIVIAALVKARPYFSRPSP